MARMEADATNAAWWRITVPCQRPLETRSPGEWWAPPDEVFHRDWSGRLRTETQPAGSETWQIYPGRRS
ncbi:L-rhamnose mutarotase [Methylobacterium mesophilicum SR1.6/6]|uniref:L-rhamnose mutarotase n=1 Tax=Methylobacterium mesophilicum SR1.6/6 TaxID=908290 RepID=A0A6B9FUU5_9HYPH|nr:L-rhamnose mutarotase [Methylobacterium mesophilicum SR1.6/6]